MRELLDKRRSLAEYDCTNAFSEARTAEPRLSEEPGIHPRQHQKTHDEIDREHDKDWRYCERKGRQLLASMAVRQFGGVEIVGVRGALMMTVAGELFRVPSFTISWAV